jgi:hypothetical protein
MWIRKQYEDAAIKIGQAFVATGGKTSINDLSVKIAQDAGLNPDGIRTLVRLANVSAFEGLFGKRASEKAGDRMIEFEVGDPEAVITRLHSDAKETFASTKTAAYDSVTDYYSDVPKKVIPLEKTASAVPGIELSTPKQQLPTVGELKLLFKRAEDKMREESKQAEIEWFTTMEKAARTLVSTDSSVESRTAFEKNAVAFLGSEIAPELLMLSTLTSKKDAPVRLCDGEKLASVISTHIANISAAQKPIIDMVKRAQEIRGKLTRCNAARTWISENVK